jgi:hypothetical protein
VSSDAPPEETIKDWLHDYLCRPNDLIGRGGAVCPFVGPAMRAVSLEIRIRPVGLAPSGVLISEMLRCALDEFDLIEWKGSNQALRSLVVAMPDLAPSRCALLDDAHRAVKPVAVRWGMMIGQFHPSCSEPAVRNPEFPVSRSPVPLVAIRLMALHDILFLHTEREWFEEYRKRFGDRYRRRAGLAEPLFDEMYGKACAKYGIEP